MSSEEWETETKKSYIFKNGIFHLVITQYDFDKSDYYEYYIYLNDKIMEYEDYSGTLEGCKKQALKRLKFFKKFIKKNC